MLNQIASGKVQTFSNAGISPFLYNSGMDKPPHYLKQWRKHAGLTQEEVADATGTTKSMISQLENFHLQLSPKWLRRLSPVLGVQQGHIIDHHPDDLDNDIIDIWARIPDSSKEQAARVLRSFVKTGTDD